MSIRQPPRFVLSSRSRNTLHTFRQEALNTAESHADYLYGLKWATRLATLSRFLVVTQTISRRLMDFLLRRKRNIRLDRGAMTVRIITFFATLRRIGRRLSGAHSTPQQSNGGE